MTKLPTKNSTKHTEEQDVTDIQNKLFYGVLWTFPIVILRTNNFVRYNPVF